MKKLIIISLLISVSIFANAQFSKLDRNLFLSQIHLVDEFIDRFNGNSIRPNLPDEFANDRKSNILLLFDLAKLKSKNDTLFKKAEEFAERVIADSVKLHYEDTTWYAKALCRGLLQKRPVDFTLYLKVERNSIGRYTWVIQGVEGNIFDLSSHKKHKPFTLMPDDHETNFMSLYRVTDETADFITDYMSKNYELDPTAVFLSWIKSNTLKIEFVKDLQFVFNQVPGYQFTIKYVNRNNLNAGWLIESFSETVETTMKKKARQVIDSFEKNINAWSETKDASRYSNAIRELCSEDFVVSDEIIRDWAAQNKLSILKYFDFNDYKRCLEDLISQGYSFHSENIRDVQMGQGNDDVSLFAVNFIIEKNDSRQIIKETIQVRNNKISIILDYQQ